MKKRKKCYRLTLEDLEDQLLTKVLKLDLTLIIDLALSLVKPDLPWYHFFFLLVSLDLLNFLEEIWSHLKNDI